MLNRVLKKAYDRMDEYIDDFCRYVKIEDIIIEYYDFKEGFEKKIITGADINLVTNVIRINQEYKTQFEWANKCKIKSLRKDVPRMYEDLIKTVMHELLHLYLYNKYKNYKNEIIEQDNKMPEIILHEDDNVIFVLYAMVLELGYNPPIKEYKNIYNKCLEISEIYKGCYGSDTYDLNEYLELQLMDPKYLIALNTYSLFHKWIESYDYIDKEAVLKGIELTEKDILQFLDSLRTLIEIELHKKEAN